MYRRDDAAGYRPGQLRLHCRYVAIAIDCLYSERLCPRKLLLCVGQYLSDQGRRQDDECRDTIDVILDDLRAQRRKPYQFCIEPDRRRYTRGANSRFLFLCLRIDAIGDRLAHVEAKLMRRERGHHDFVGFCGISHPALRHCDSILIKKEAVDTRDRVSQRGRCQSRRTVGPQRCGREQYPRLHVAHIGQVRNLVGQPGRIVGVGRRVVCVGSVDRDDQVRWVGAGQERAEGRLGAASRGEASHGHSADQPYEEDDGQIGTPPLAERGSKPVPRRTERMWCHGEAPLRLGALTASAPADPRCPTTPPGKSRRNRPAPAKGGSIHPMAGTSTTGHPASKFALAGAHSPFALP
jgi:hypothetical protein